MPQESFLSDRENELNVSDDDKQSNGSVGIIERPQYRFSTVNQLRPEYGQESAEESLPTDSDLNEVSARLNNDKHHLVPDKIEPALEPEN